LNYDEFVKSLTKSRLYKVDKSAPDVAFQVQEPSYILGTSGTKNKKFFIHEASNIKKTVDSFLKRHPLNSTDRWWVSLSTEHVSGFSIVARSYFANLKKPLEEPFVLDPVKIIKEKVTVLSLVPTQIFDIVSKELVGPNTLKYVFVGGAPLSEELYAKAIELGWPLVPCFGSTETFAQFASSNNNKDYTVYDEWSFKSNKRNELQILGPSLFSYEVLADGTHILRSDKWHTLSDRVSVKAKSFSFESRSDDQYKHKGKLYSFFDQKKEFEKHILENKLSMKNSFLVVLEEGRAGAGLYLVSSDFEDAELILKKMPNIRGCFFYKNIDFLLSKIGKPVKSKLEDALSRPLLLS
jgi:O-succinylbenzoic acid--CoA ligase